MLKLCIRIAKPITSLFLVLKQPCNAGQLYADALFLSFFEFCMKIIVIAGTRPEAVKLAPVVMELKKHKDITTVVCNSGQHQQMIEDAFSDFGIVPDISLNVMCHGQSLASLTAKLFTAIDEVFERENPDWVIVQGDTTTVMVGAMCAFYRHIRIAHVEAGLRSYDKYAPFPEEVNRQTVTRIADLHFAPTGLAYNNLIKEGISPDNVYITGNTVIDALMWVRDYLKDKNEYLHEDVRKAVEQGKKIILVTGHRRENQGTGLVDICNAIKHLSYKYMDCIFVYPVHLNPAVQNTVRTILSNHARVMLLPPLSYLHFQALLNVSYLVLTDSGGIQEEAPALSKPVLVMREVTERPEGIQAGCARLVGASTDAIVDGVSELIENAEEYNRMKNAQNPYGHGHSSEKIVSAILRASGYETGLMAV